MFNVHAAGRARNFALLWQLYGTASRSEPYGTAALQPLLVTGTLHARVMKMAVQAGIRVLLPHQSNLLLRTTWQSANTNLSFEMAISVLENLLCQSADTL